VEGASRKLKPLSPEVWGLQKRDLDIYTGLGIAVLKYFAKRGYYSCCQ